VNALKPNPKAWVREAPSMQQQQQQQQQQQERALPLDGASGAVNSALPARSCARPCTTFWRCC
jgi:hypothetical protein